MKSIRTVDLLDKLTADADKGWATYNRGKPMTPRQLAKQLATYGIKPKTVRQGKKDTPKGYEVAQFEDAFRRYLTAPPPEPSDMADETPEVAATAQQFFDLTPACGRVADPSEAPGDDGLADRY